MDVLVKVDDLKDGKVILLLEEHHKEMQLYSPPESIHALDKSKFKGSSLVFWSASLGESLVGCGALFGYLRLSGGPRSICMALARLGGRGFQSKPVL